MSVLVDSSVWIDYFRGDEGDTLDTLIDENLAVTNDLILAEIVPPLRLRRQRKLIALLQAIDSPPLEIDWDDLIAMQVTCMKHGINKVGIPDLIIAQHAIQHDLQLFSRDKHFERMGRHLPLACLRPSRRP